MRIQHNIAALNSYRNLTGNNSAVSKNLEKLSSGYRINRAGDDAAGLAISEKMRAQITGLNTAQKNAQDGVSLVQTAEGALNETHSILQRMNELATQAANGTNTTVDRSAIKAELDQLTSEIDRIQSTTQFNTMNLLDGTFSGATNKMKLQVGALSGQSIDFSIANMCASKIGLKAALSVSTFTKAGSYMKSVQDAIEVVSKQRSAMGAIQNRLEHTIANLDTTSENTQSAESRIRDTDMASEMVTYSKNNILAQAGQSMLAQANQSTQGVLSLLQ